MVIAIAGDTIDDVADDDDVEVDLGSMICTSSSLAAVGVDVDVAAVGVGVDVAAVGVVAESCFRFY